jgi:Ca2+-binding EF-hand superfamily protein
VREDFIKLYKQLYPEKKCDEFMSTLFSLFDFDKSGFITFGEFTIAIYLSGKSNPVEKLRLVFRMYDYNHSGDIDRNEIERILKSIASVSDEIDYDMIMHWDKNGNGKLTEDEFVDFIMGNPTLKKYFIDLIKTHDA